MVPAQRTRLKILTAFIAGSVAMGCGSDSGDKPGNGDSDAGGGPGAGPGGGTGGGGSETLTLTFNPMYSAFGGSHKFKVPVKVEGKSGDLKVTTSPADFVDFEGTADGVMLTMRKAGDATVTITDGAGNTGKAELHVTAVTDADWDTGKDRYNSGVPAITLPEGGIQFPDASFMIPEGGINFDAGLMFDAAGFDSGIVRNTDAACASCHTSAGGGARTLPDGGMINIDVEHTPQQTAGYSDDTLVAIFTMGKKPDGAPYRVLRQPIGMTGIMIPEFIAAMIYQGFHKWDVSESDRKGIITYLRGLEPKAQGPVDFGGLLPPRGMRPAGGDTAGGGTTGGGGGTTGGGATSDAGGATTDAGVDAGT